MQFDPVPFDSTIDKYRQQAEALLQTDATVQNAASDTAAQQTIARWYDFADWTALSKYVEDVTQPDSPVYLFESAVEAVIDGDLPGLQSLLREHPELVRARSTRITHFDPPVHRATLLHY